jgi:uncharacterized protein (DUF427 family)
MQAPPPISSALDNSKKRGALWQSRQPIGRRWRNDPPGVTVTPVDNDFRKGTLMTTRTVLIPDATHPITISPTGSRVTVRVGGVTVAETERALSLAEANYPVVQYIPLEDVDQSLLDRTTTQTYCPYKGDASYYSVKTPDGTAETDLIWTYEHPYPSVAEIAGHVAFYPNRAEITVA